jgi:hypothetical protein
MNIQPPSGSSPPKRFPLRFLGGIVLFIGLIFVGLAVQEWRYESGGDVVPGTVVRKVATVRKGRGSSSSWYVMYRFTTRQGQTVEGKDEVFPERWRSLEEGGPLEVEYLSNSPETNRIPGETVSGATYSAIGVVLLLAGAALLARGRRKTSPQTQP